VIAMWEPMARALGWPRKHIGFADVIRLAGDKRGWAAYGKPEFGPFKLVHTNPDFSTSGLSAVVAEYYAATGKKEGLTEAEVTGSKSRRTVRQIERSIVHYGDTTLFIADRMREQGPSYASAAAMEEATLLDFNANRQGRDRLIALYPEEGTFFSDNPLIVLDAPWVTPEQRQGAQAFQRFIAQHVSAAVAARAGFRPPSLDEKPVAPITAANGADPAQPTRELGLPEPRVLAAIKKSWRADRKPADILLVLDTSGSMNDESRLQRAKQGLKVFFDQIAPQDSVGLTVFSDRIRPLLPVRPFKAARPELERKVRDLFADGGTAFYDAASEAYDTVRRGAGDTRINAVVLLTDGEDTDSAVRPDDLVQRLRDGSEGAGQVRVFTIAYSASAAGAARQLEAIAKASGGQAYTSDTADIETVYRSISSFF
jgi:Ca-activated chloride channel family protein